MPRFSRRVFPAAGRLSRVVAELLESRELLSGTLRIVSYNIDADTTSFENNPQAADLETVLEGIGAAHLNDHGISNAQPIDVLALQETKSGSGGANAPSLATLVGNLNTTYGAGVYSFDATADPTTGGTGGGPSALIYNTRTIQVLGAAPLGTASSSGAPRAPMQYLLHPIGYGSADNFYLDVSHMKSGTPGEDSNNPVRRNDEATTIASNATGLGSSAHVISVGDFNITGGSAEQTYQTMIAAFDDVAMPTESWSDATAANAKAISGLLSESATADKFRDDIQFVSPAADPASNAATAGLQYASGSFTVFGNGGSTSLYGKSISSTTANPNVFPDFTTSQRTSILSAETLGTDHLPVVADYSIVASSGPPQIGSFAASPASVVSGNNVILTAGGVAETGGAISSVNFYRESNSSAGLQVGSDTLLGSGMQAGSTWTLANVATAGLAAGSYTFYAVATDTEGASSTTAATTVMVSAGPPSIASLAANPTTVSAGNSFALTAGNANEPGGVISSVSFYRESNGVGGLQATSDTLLGTGTQNGAAWTLANVATTGLAAGSYTYYAFATDSAGASSTPASASLTVTSVASIGTFAANPASVPIGVGATLTAGDVADSGSTISAVDFYLESNGNGGLQIGSDTLIGSGSQSGSTWTIAAPTSGLPAGSYMYYAIASDAAGSASIAMATTLVVTASAQPLVNIQLLAAADPNGPFSSNLQVSPGQTIYYEALGQMAPVGSTNGGKSITSLTAHPGVATINYDGLYSLFFNLAEAGGFSGAFATAALASNPATGDDWSKGPGASAGTLAGATLSAIRPIQSSGIFAAATSAETILTGSFTVASDAQPGATATVAGTWSGGGIGSFAINSNPITGLSATKIAIAAGDPNGYVHFSPFTLITTASFPAWLAPLSAATWNAISHTLTVTGPTMIIADPGTDAPDIVESGSAAQLTIVPTSNDIDIHIGGITLSGGAIVDMKTVGSGRSHGNHNVLVVGAATAATDPAFSIDSTSTLNLEDNDLIVHTPAGDMPTQATALLGTVQAAAAIGRNVAPGGIFDGTWTGKGLTSTSAATADAAAGYEQNVLAVALNSDLFLGAFSQWKVGSAIETLGFNDVIIKYTYNGDLTLQGQVSDDAATVFGAFYDNGAAPQNDFAFGDLNGDGKVDDSDATIFGAVFGNGTAASRLATL